MARQHYFKTIIIILFPIFLSSCVKEGILDEDIEPKNQASKLYVGETLQLKSNDKNTKWKSSNKYVGTIDEDGLFTAHHIGKVKINATNEGKKNSTEITVVPKITDIPEPVIKFGGSKEQIKDLEKRNLLHDSGPALSFETDSPYVESLYYVFQGGKCAYAIVRFKNDPSIDIDYILAFFQERYEAIGTDKDDYYFTDQKRKIVIAVSTKDQFNGRYAVYEKKKS
ncbi:Ig-like domain-containing protein [Sphingobacterium sp.]|uniref:Ig-like domain-containing protein n=1 Tax=Sphingobacterium sp. TaxID=341027 RepID=UPI0028ACA583|nr:Ig-like domain-containing protein [Sphingobacterium sp.]